MQYRIYREHKTWTLTVFSRCFRDNMTSKAPTQLSVPTPAAAEENARSLVIVAYRVHGIRARVLSATAIIIFIL